MAFPKMTEDVENITPLDNTPTPGYMSADELKALFDAAGVAIKDYINNTLLPALESTDEGESGAESIGIEAYKGLTATTLQEALELLYDLVDGATAGAIPDWSLTSEKYQDGSVGTAALTNGGVTDVKIAAGAVTGAKVANATLQKQNFANGSVDSDILASASVTHSKLGANAVQQDNINDEAVGTDQLEDGAVTYSKTDGIQKKITALAVSVPAITADSYEQVSVSGVTSDATCHVVVEADPADAYKWRDSGVICTAHGNGTLTFYAESDVVATTANVLIIDLA